MPPSWNPDNALPAAEKEAKVYRRDAALQVELAKATAAWALAHSVDIPDAAGHVERARTLLGTVGPTDAFWVEVESIWTAVRALVPMPSAPGRPAVVPAAEGP